MGKWMRTVNSYTRSRGFTLLELVVVMIIMVIILGVTIPRFGGILGGGDLTGFSRHVAAYLRNARELSVVRGRPISIEFNETDSLISCIDGPEGTPSLDPVPVPGTISMSVTSREGPDGSGVVTFHPLGNATDARIVLHARDGKVKTIKIEGMTGEVYIE